MTRRRSRRDEKQRKREEDAAHIFCASFFCSTEFSFSVFVSEHQLLLIFFFLIAFAEFGPPSGVPRSDREMRVKSAGD